MTEYEDKFEYEDLDGHKLDEEWAKRNNELWEKLKKIEEKEEAEGKDWTVMGHMREAVHNRDLHNAELSSKLRTITSTLTKLHESTGMLNDINTLSLNHDDDEGYKRIAEDNKLRAILRKAIEE